LYGRKEANMTEDVRLLLSGAISTVTSLLQEKHVEACFRSREVAKRAERLGMAGLTAAALNLEFAIKSGLQVAIRATSSSFMHELNIAVLVR
jgi:hypothetical protein